MKSISIILIVVVILFTGSIGWSANSNENLLAFFMVAEKVCKGISTGTITYGEKISDDCTLICHDWVMEEDGNWHEENTYRCTPEQAYGEE